MRRQVDSSAWATAPLAGEAPAPGEDWTEVLAGCPAEGEVVQLWVDGEPPTSGQLSGNDWLLRDGRRVPVAMGDLWRRLPVLRRWRKPARGCVVTEAAA
jgi:hypothetical protein